MHTESSNSQRNTKTWIMLGQTQRAMFRARQKGLSPFDISPEQSATLVVIETLGDKATPTEIARCIFREPSTVSELLNRMEKKGLLSKAANSKKKNSVKVQLTPKGKEVFKNSLQQETINDIMSSLSESEHQQLRLILEKIWSSSLEQLNKRRQPIFPAF